MIEKMGLEKFQQIKNQLVDSLKRYEQYVEIHEKDETFDKEKLQQKFIERYVSIQNLLLGYDLSEIPFESWSDFAIFTDEENRADFSKTRANIDFELVTYLGNGNFRGCNIKNLDKVERRLDPDDFDEQTIRANSSLFLTDIFSDDFKEKYYSSNLTISDLAILSKEQLEELKQKNFVIHINYDELNRLLLETIGIDKIVQLYNHSKQEFEAVNKLVKRKREYDILEAKSTGIPSFEEFLEQIKSVDVTELKNVCFDFFRKQITNSSLLFIQEDYPELFIRENADIFLLNAEVPDEVKQSYFTRSLKVRDLLYYPEVFESISVDYFMANDTYISQFIRDNYGMGKFQELVKKYPDIFRHIQKEKNFYEFSQYLKAGPDIETTFISAVKHYFLTYGKPDNFRTIIDGKITYNIPDWLSSMSFKFVESLEEVDELLQYNNSVFVLDYNQRKVLDTFNIENIKRFEQETGFFTHGVNKLEMFNAFCYYYSIYRPITLVESDLKNGKLSYEDFLNLFANCLDGMRKNNIFTDFPNYDWIKGDFRNNHPEIFVDLNAPAELKEAFYKNRITLEFLYNHKEYIPYLINKNLSNIIKTDIKLNVLGSVDAQGTVVPNSVNFIDEYVSRYGNEKLLKLVSKYGSVLSSITITSLNGEIENEELIEKALRTAIYERIINEKFYYAYLSDVPEIKTEHPELFVNFENLSGLSQEEKQSLTKAFYSRVLSFDDIKKHPELITMLKDKNLFIAFGYKNGGYEHSRSFLNISDKHTGYNEHSDLKLLEVFGNEKFLQLCSKYGRYMDGIEKHLYDDIVIRNGRYFEQNNLEKELSFEDICKRIEKIISRECQLGNIDYYPDDAPTFLREANPELFLSDDAPDELKLYFYNYDNSYPMTFEILQNHKEWLPFLKDKALKTSLLRKKYLKQDLIHFLELFGEEKAINLGINRAETVTEMMKSHQIELMKNWYDKTGGKFIPDFVVMQNFSFDEADKFLISGSNWSSLMRIKSFAATQESRDAMLKLAYSFGAFDQDQRGFKKILDLLTRLPKKIDADRGYIIERIDNSMLYHSQIIKFFPKKMVVDELGRVTYESIDMTIEEKENAYNKMFNYVKEQYDGDGLIDKNVLVNLLESLKKENVDIDFSEPIFAQLYRKNDDGSYSLTISSQSYPKTAEVVRNILEKFRELPILTPENAHHYFGGFKLEYDADFREFFLSNYDVIMNNVQYLYHISSIQRRFKEIKTVYSNVNLTIELAMSYINNNKYTNVNVGNEKVTQVAALQNYSQEDFEILQQLYNYGKQRIFSSIPRIESETKIELTSGTYHYEMLRLDDPRAMSIGFESDCCQRLHEAAEWCMGHSMIDKNGRVFVITNEAGEVIAQSWVWRNKDVLCFDNIEIPDQKMWDSGIRRGLEDSEIKNEFTDDVLYIYKIAAQKLIEEDKKVYKELLESGKINQEQYDGLRLGKVTTGLGFSNIKGSLATLPIDKSNISRPLPFEAPAELSQRLYIGDSNTQYILEERDDRKEYNGETLSIHNDTYIEYSDSNFTEKNLLNLQKLELVTKEYTSNLETSIGDYTKEAHFVTEIAKNYGLNPDTTKIVMNPNFAIIYDINGNELRIGDLLFNTKIDNKRQKMDIENKVVIQMRLALEQIGNGKKIDISELGKKQQAMYAKIIGLTNEIDIERGVGHAK